MRERSKKEKAGAKEVLLNCEIVIDVFISWVNVLLCCISHNLYIGYTLDVDSK